MINSKKKTLSISEVETSIKILTIKTPTTRGSAYNEALQDLLKELKSKK